MLLLTMPSNDGNDTVRHILEMDISKKLAIYRKNPKKGYSCCMRSGRVPHTHDFNVIKNSFIFYIKCKFYTSLIQHRIIRIELDVVKGFYLDARGHYLEQHYFIFMLVDSS